MLSAQDFGGNTGTAEYINQVDLPQPVRFHQMTDDFKG